MACSFIIIRTNKKCFVLNSALILLVDICKAVFTLCLVILSQNLAPNFSYLIKFSFLKKKNVKAIPP